MKGQPGQLTNNQMSTQFDTWSDAQLANEWSKRNPEHGKRTQFAKQYDINYSHFCSYLNGNEKYPKTYRNAIIRYLQSDVPLTTPNHPGPHFNPFPLFPSTRQGESDDSRNVSSISSATTTYNEPHSSLPTPSTTVFDPYQQNTEAAAPTSAPVPQNLPVTETSMLDKLREQSDKTREKDTETRALRSVLEGEIGNEKTLEATIKLKEERLASLNVANTGFQPKTENSSFIAQRLEQMEKSLQQEILSLELQKKKQKVKLGELKVDLQNLFRKSEAIRNYHSRQLEMLHENYNKQSERLKEREQSDLAKDSEQFDESKDSEQSEESKENKQSNESKENHEPVTQLEMQMTQEEQLPQQKRMDPQLLLGQLFGMLVAMIVVGVMVAVLLKPSSAQ